MAVLQVQFNAQGHLILIFLYILLYLNITAFFLYKLASNSHFFHISKDVGKLKGQIYNYQMPFDNLFILQLI
jgi:polyferredoxin